LGALSLLGQLSFLSPGHWSLVSFPVRFPLFNCPLIFTAPCPLLRFLVPVLCSTVCCFLNIRQHFNIPPHPL
jgi:hypothetical protein